MQEIPGCSDVAVEDDNQWLNLDVEDVGFQLFNDNEIVSQASNKDEVDVSLEEEDAEDEGSTVSHSQRHSSRPPNPPIGGGPGQLLEAQVSLKLLFGYVTIFSSADLFTTDLNCRKKLACDIISECYVILSRRI